MSKNQQFSTSISNEEYQAKAEEVYQAEVRPYLERNRKAYQKYLQDKETLSLTAAQKAHLQCQSPI